MTQWNQDNIKTAIDCPMTRRRFMKWLTAAGAAAMLPCGFLRSGQAMAAGTVYEGGYDTFRNACPRNCYDTCGMVTHVKDGVAKFVEGAPESTFTNGGLCVKGHSYIRRLYSPDRIKYPMVQQGRGTGNWKRISWDEALTRISEKFIEINEKDGSMLGLALTKYSGNFGITNYGVEGMFSSLGYTTRMVGTPCWPAGIDAQNYDMGNMWCNDPEDMVNARYIILWGVNPAWCSVHTMKYIYEAKRRGAKILCIDPVLTQTAAKADEYWQVRTSEDGALALGMARHILDKGLVDQDWVNQNAVGFAEFADYLNSEVTLEWAAEKSGVPAERIARVAEEFAGNNPATIWIGYGMQRHVNGGASVRAIDALVAMTGNVGKVGGGARYGHLMTWGFNYHAMVQQPPKGVKGYLGPAAKGEFDFTKDQEGPSYSNRTLNINKTARELLNASDPPVRALWVSCKNPLSQDFDRNQLIKAFNKMEMVVVVDQFFNQTVEQADIVLPVTTLFEEWTVNVGYWHYWISLNEQSVKPLYESKSNLEIAAALSKKMNQLKPGSCTFPTEIDTREWLEKEFNSGVYGLFGLNSWQDLKKGMHKAGKHLTAWADGKFGTPSGKYEFKSDLCAEHGFNALPKYVDSRKPYDKLRVLTPHTQFGLHSQFVNLDWMEDFNPKPYVYIHPDTAKARGIADGDTVVVKNKTGSVTIEASLTDNVPTDAILMYEAWFRNNDYNCQNLVDDTSADMGAYKAGAPGVAIHDQFADVTKA
ncbi:MAG: molybdopterin-dependent oxidoreductase [Desulfobacter sp.]